MKISQIINNLAIAITISTSAILFSPLSASSAPKPPKTTEPWETSVDAPTTPAGDSISFDLNCVISGSVSINNTVSSYGGNQCSPVDTSFGKVTLTQYGTAVQVFIDLAGDQKHKIQEFALNFDPIKNAALGGLTIQAITPYSLSSAPVLSVNGTGLNPYTGMDINVDPVNTGSTNDGFKALITSLNGVSINDFNFKDTAHGSAGIYAAVHIGNYGNQPGQQGNDSIKVGSLGGTKPVPVPGFVLGIMAAGAFGGSRLLKKNKQVA